MRTKTHDLSRRAYEPADRRARRKNAFQEPHALEQFELLRSALQEVFSSRVPWRRRLKYRYIRILCPARGGHSLSTSFLWRVRAVSWLKLFREMYSPRKRSSTVANRKTPPPAKLSSSN